MVSDADLSLAVEKIIHEVYADCAQRIFDQHGIVVHEVRYTWIDTSTVGKRDVYLDSVRAVTETRR